MSTVVHRWVAACESGSNPRVIARLRSGWAVLGEAQFVRGYSLLLPNPVVGDLNQLEGATRQQFLTDYAGLGDALLEVTGAVRINYEILGNLEPALHAHAFPRYDTEPEELRTKPVWFYDWDTGPQFDAKRDTPLIDAIRTALTRADLIVSPSGR